LNDRSVALAPDACVFIDRPSSRVVRFLDVANGRALAGDENAIAHHAEITRVVVNQVGSAQDRKVAFVDVNRDVHVASAFGGGVAVKLGGMVDSVLFADVTDALAAMVDQRLVVWLHPNAAFVDKDVVDATKITREGDFGKLPALTSFRDGSRATIRRIDGASIHVTVSPHLPTLHAHLITGAFDKAIRLCRFVKEESLWACVAVAAVAAKDLRAAEVAYAACEAVEKVRFLRNAREISSAEGRNAELALFRRKPDEAEAILLHAGLIYRAIDARVRLFDWRRALDLATKHGMHVDTVLYHRRAYLKSAGRKETDGAFLDAMRAVDVSEEAVLAKIAEEREREGTGRKTR
jgi:intraflagellar transport protein 80